MKIIHLEEYCTVELGYFQLQLGNLLMSKYGDVVCVLDFSPNKNVIFVSSVKNHNWWGNTYTIEQLKDLGYRQAFLYKKD